MSVVQMWLDCGLLLVMIWMFGSVLGRHFEVFFGCFSFLRHVKQLNVYIRIRKGLADSPLQKMATKQTTAMQTLCFVVIAVCCCCCCVLIVIAAAAVLSCEFYQKQPSPSNPCIPVEPITCGEKLPQHTLCNFLSTN